MELKDFYYNLPPQLIAQHPLEKREGSRLMMIDREKELLTHAHFTDIVDELHAGDLLVMNDTRVIPARLYGVKEGSGGKIEFLLLRKLSDNRWEVVLKPGRRAREGARFTFGDGALKAEILGIGEGGVRIAQFEFEGIFEQVLDRLGEIPLPHYITEKLADKDRYQTVYAKHDGSVAAPTAGLHFTDETLDKLRAKGVDTAFVTLHVGLGTFRPVKVQKITEHKMHAEYFVLPQETVDKLNKTKKQGGRVVCVGTTSCRVLETAAQKGLPFEACSGATDIFIYPGYTFKAVDALITNFHLPESTLLMLVSALMGHERMQEVYAEAVKEKYRFFSFGDAMFIQ
ncbi:MAG: tRNA preQ1(34) S-adenosylmethionine ribosyltransferase-isomerase QueA [Hyphomonadaceae bacterium]|nr:tRNA preQ1(34) S-adenosylmethionine ribosyltransferase-isomerase QueA [Clostridia bacterium]